MKLKTKLISEICGILSNNVGGTLIPILSAIKIEHIDGVMKFTTSDTEKFTTISLDIEGNNGSYCIDFDKFKKYISTIKYEEIDMSFNDKNIIIKTQSDNIKIPLLNVFEYKVPDFYNGELSSIDGKQFLNGILKTEHCVAVKSMKPIYTGLKIFNQGDKTYFAGTNDTAFIEYQINYKTNLNVSIPKASLKSIIDILKIVNNISVGCSSNSMYMKSETENFVIEYQTLLMQGQFPDYQSLFPTENESEISFDRDSMVNGLSKIMIATSENLNSVKVIVDKDILLTSESISNDEVSTNIEGDIKGGFSMVINGKVISEILSKIQEPVIYYSYKKPLIIKSKTDLNIIYMLQVIHL